MLDQSRVPAEIRSLRDGRALVLYRDAFRGYTPAGASAVELRNADGTIAWQSRPGLDIPDATIMTLLDATLTDQGRVVLSLVAARPGLGTVHVLSFYPVAPGEAVRIVVVPVACFRIAAAIGDGVWCLGPDVAKHNQGNADFQFLHQFSEDGRLRRSIVERKSLSMSPRPWDGRVQITATRQGVAVWMAGRKELALFDYSGQLLQLTQVPEAPLVSDERTDFALDNEGSLFALGITDRPTEQLASWKRSLFEFVPSTATWRASSLAGLSLAVRLVGSANGDVTLWDRERPRLVRLSARK